MKYQLFSMPACPTCAEIKQYLKDKIEGEEHSLADTEGVLIFRKIYPQIKDKVKRNKDGSLPIPTILFLDDDNKIINIAQDLNKVKQIIENKKLKEI